ncbi:MAG: hypothetical protein HY072_00705 [Deltaproteobacteria bacterium]|nr:hypothetical protein [Deltaproteobacteria bacterium]
MSGLDPVGRKEMRELLVEQVTSGRTVFFSSHVIPDVEAICNQVAVINKGKILSCGPIGGFLSKGPLQTEIAFQGLSFEKAQKISFFQSLKQMPDGFRAMVSSQQEVHQSIEQLIRFGATILWVIPVRPSLEDLFMSQIGES